MRLPDTCARQYDVLIVSGGGGSMNSVIYWYETCNFAMALSQRGQGRS